MNIIDMKKILRTVVYTVAPAETRFTLNDMLTQVHHTMDLIKAATSPEILMLIENKIEQISLYYRKVSNVLYWVGKLRAATHSKRCELLAREYPENEEA